jgi:UPF0755 protein
MSGDPPPFADGPVTPPGGTRAGPYGGDVFDDRAGYGDGAVYDDRNHSDSYDDVYDDRAGASTGPDTGPVVGPLTDASHRDLQRRRQAFLRRQRRRRRRRVVLVLGVLALVLLGLLAFYVVEANPLGGRGPRVILQVKAGESSTGVVDALAGRGVIGSSLAFRMGELVYGTPSVLPGTYLFHQNESFGDVRAILSGGPNVTAITVLPGYSLHEMAGKLDGVQTDLGTKLLAAATAGTVRSPWEPVGSNNLEGLLGTGTYQVLPGTSAKTLLTTMVDRFDRKAAAAGATPAAAAALGITPYQLITVASIVEKEGYTPDSNFGPVARVIYNRLARNMRLSMDSTVLYSLGQDGGPVTSADLQLNTPYNTYLHTGLTPTPICFPSETALRAAANPPAGDWLYFVVVQKDGTEAFSSTFAGQEANEALAKSRGLG